MNPALEVMLYDKDRGNAFDYSSPLAFLISVYKSADVPLHTRLRAAAEAAKYRHATYRAIAQAPLSDFAEALEAKRLAQAKARAAKVANVVKLAVDASQNPIQHSAAELTPDSARQVQSTNDFKRRI
jgi:hypothetical protein